MINRQEMVEVLRDYCSGDLDSIFDLDDKCQEYMENNEEYRKENAQALAIQGMNIFSMTQNLRNAYYLLSFLLWATEDLTVLKTLLRYCIVDDLLTKEQKFLVYYQGQRWVFLHPSSGDTEVSQLFFQLYSQIYDSFCSALQIEKRFVPVNERNEDVVVVLISQVLQSVHGPTKTLFDRCRVLKNRLNKEVFIINTAELTGDYKILNYFRVSIGGYMEEYSKANVLAYEGDEYKFMQCSSDMPKEEGVREVIRRIRELNPYYIVTIGGNSIVSDLCSNYYPTLVVGTVHSALSMTKGQFQAIGRSITEEERQWLSSHGHGEEHIIESLFTFSFEPQTHTYTRAEFGLPEDRFIVELVGGRLDAEVDEDCRSLIRRLMEQGVYFVFLGVFNRYEEYAKEDEVFAENSAYLGFQEDVLAIDELCDLYLNPYRVGGGTSAAEALSKGVPVVTFNYGDVGIGAGEAFHIASYEEAYDVIMRYQGDKEFYERQSQAAKERAKRLTDSDGEFIKVIEEMESRQAFR